MFNIIKRDEGIIESKATKIYPWKQTRQAPVYHCFPCKLSLAIRKSINKQISSQKTSNTFAKTVYNSSQMTLYNFKFTGFTIL